MSLGLPFSPNATVSLAVTGTTGNVGLTGIGSTLEIKNIGGATAFVSLGTDNTAVATTSSYPVLAGETTRIGIGDAITYIAAITAVDTTTIYLTRGEGR